MGHPVKVAVGGTPLGQSLHLQQLQESALCSASTQHCNYSRQVVERMPSVTLCAFPVPVEEALRSWSFLGIAPGLEIRVIDTV